MKSFNRPCRTRRNERGAALMMIALSMTGVISVTGVVVDGSNAFAQRRQMQNSADSAALAGAAALDRLAPFAETAIWTAVRSSAQSNGADIANITCRLASDVLVDLGPCPTTNTGTAAVLRETASAVKVRVGTTKDTSFIQVVGVDQFTARAPATAQIEGLRASNSPFAVCAVGDSDPRSAGDGLPDADAILLPDNSMNLNAFGKTYELQDPTTIGCGQGNSFKGLTENSTTEYPVPGPWNLAHGDHGINVANAVVAGNSACRTGITLNCIVFVPLCHAADPPVNDLLYCERFGAFRIVEINGASRLGGVLVDGVVATGGQGGGHAQPGEARVIKLSE